MRSPILEWTIAYALFTYSAVTAASPKWLRCLARTQGNKITIRYIWLELSDSAKFFQKCIIAENLIVLVLYYLYIEIFMAQILWRHRDTIQGAYFWHCILPIKLLKVFFNVAEWNVTREISYLSNGFLTHVNLKAFLRISFCFSIGVPFRGLERVSLPPRRWKILQYKNFNLILHLLSRKIAIFPKLTQLFHTYFMRRLSHLPAVMSSFLSLSSIIVFISSAV